MPSETTLVAPSLVTKRAFGGGADQLVGVDAGIVPEATGFNSVGVNFVCQLDTKRIKETLILRQKA